jgi:hypothetical protein
MNKSEYFNETGINTGEILESVLRNENVNIAKLAKSLNVNRGTIYHWFKKQNIPKEKLYEIGYLINYEFGHYFQESMYFSKRFLYNN